MTLNPSEIEKLPEFMTPSDVADFLGYAENSKQLRTESHLKKFGIQFFHIGSKAYIHRDNLIKWLSEKAEVNTNE